MLAFDLRVALVLALGACGMLAAGCVSDQTRADELLRETSTSARASAPLGGEALAQRRIELERTARDLAHLNVTLESLHRRNDRDGLLLFSEFVDHLLAKQVLPILEGDWQSKHPEVAAADINVRLAVAELWLRLGSSASTDQMLEEIERRYAGRGEMLVHWANGRQGTLRDGIARLRNRNWWDG